MNSFLNSIISLSPVLLVAMPVAGACFGWGISRLGLEFNRWTAFSNTIVTALILGTVIFAPFIKDNQKKAESQPTRKISISLKLPDVASTKSAKVSQRTFKWSLDSTTVWFLMLPTCLWPVLVLFSHRVIDASRFHYFLLLLLQALLSGVLVSHDLISFISFLLLTTFCMLCLIRLWSGSRSRDVFESTMYLQFLGDGLIIGGLLLTAVAYQWMQGVLLEAPQPLTFQMTQLLQGTVSDLSLYPLAEVYWGTISPWIFLLLLTGFTIKGMFFPVHYGIAQWLSVVPNRPLSNTNPLGWYLVLLALMTKICIYGMIRFMIPLNFGVGSELSSVLACWGICGFLLAALIAFVRRDLLQIIVWFLIGQTSLTLTILFASESTTVSNFILLNVTQGLACCLLLLVIPLISHAAGSRTDKLLMLVAAFSVMTVIGAPGLGGFTALIALIWNLVNKSLSLGFCYLLGTLLFNLALTRAFWQLVKPDRTETDSIDGGAQPVLNENIGLTYLAFSPALALILLLGISPATLTEKSSFAFKEIHVSSSGSSSAKAD